MRRERERDRDRERERERRGDARLIENQTRKKDKEAKVRAKLGWVRERRRSRPMIMNYLAWVQTDSLVYYGLGFEFSPVSFLSILCHGSRKFARVSKNNLATSFQEAPCRISMIGMESRI